MRKRITGNHPIDERAHAVAIARDLTHYVTHHDFVIAFQLAAQGVGQQSLHQIAGNVAVSSGDDGFQIRWTRKTLCPWQFTSRIDGLAIAILVAPSPDGIELL